MELDGVGWNVINSLLEKDNVIRAHFFKNKKSMILFMKNYYNLNYNDT